MSRESRQKANSQPDNQYIEKKDSWSSHAIIFEWLSHSAPGSKILDIGTASGMLGKRFKDFGFYLKGLEPIQKWAEEARPFYNEFHCSTIEAASDEFLAKQDVVICADVLEHTPNPEEILKRLISLQKPSTQFIISVPNVAYLWIRLNLLFGRFCYTDCGILDRTHLRFFTKIFFLEMLKAVGLEILEIRCTPPPLERINHKFFKSFSGQLVHNIFACLANFLPGLFAYQFVTRLEISDD